MDIDHNNSKYLFHTFILPMVSITTNIMTDKWINAPKVVNKEKIILQK